MTDRKPTAAEHEALRAGASASHDTALHAPAPSTADLAGAGA